MVPMRQQSAFSLVELSIVLVILGLLVGGVLSGQALIRAAELRAVNADIQRYTASVYAFRDRYFSIPGDFTDAEKFWGTMSTGTCPNATAGTGTQTCNGNGDGHINGATAASRTGESFLFWQHLANAGLIEGSYTGIASAGTTLPGREATLGINIPKSRMSNVGYSVEYNTGGSFGIGNKNFIYIGSVSNSPAWNDFLRPEEAWNIDTKVDDGRPGSGIVINSSSAVGTCVTSASAATAVYKLDNPSIACGMFVIGNF